MLKPEFPWSSNPLTSFQGIILYNFHRSKRIAIRHVLLSQRFVDPSPGDSQVHSSISTNYSPIMLPLSMQVRRSNTCPFTSSLPTILGSKQSFQVKKRSAAFNIHHVVSALEKPSANWASRFVLVHRVTLTFLLPYTLIQLTTSL